ncbi:ArsR family transcriptional regulator, partial [bacterium]|nr:ArsR family transcriptional regulator [bacterium]
MTVESNAKGREAGLERRAELFKALADPTRLQVVNALLERPHCAEELSGRLRRAPSTISFHLR